jgi:hypothetical protein
VVEYEKISGSDDAACLQVVNYDKMRGSVIVMKGCTVKSRVNLVCCRRVGSWIKPWGWQKMVFLSITLCRC